MRIPSLKSWLRRCPTVSPRRTEVSCTTATYLTVGQRTSSVVPQAAALPRPLALTSSVAPTTMALDLAPDTPLPLGGARARMLGRPRCSLQLLALASSIAHAARRATLHPIPGERCHEDSPLRPPPALAALPAASPYVPACFPYVAAEEVEGCCRRQ